MIKGKIGIVIVNYNGEKYQNDALRSIYSSTYQNFEIILVDSHSRDASVEMAREEFPAIHCLLQDENVGVAKGNNIGIRYAMDILDVEYVLLSNNDIIIAADTIQKMVERADSKTAVVPKIYYYEPKDQIWYAGGAMNWRRGESEHIGNFEQDLGQYDEERIVEYAPSCFIIYHRDLLNAVGKIDENVFMYFDDTDFCARVTEAGFRILYAPSAVMWHKVSSAGGGMDSKIYVYYMTRNKLYFMEKHRKQILFPARLYTYTKMIVKWIISPIYKSNDRYILQAWKDYRHGIHGRVDCL